MVLGVYTYAIFTGLYCCSMATSRIIRIGYRNFIVRIAAASQHVLVCITRKVRRLENVTVLILASNRLGFCVGG